MNRFNLVLAFLMVFFIVPSNAGILPKAILVQPKGSNFVKLHHAHAPPSADLIDVYIDEASDDVEEDNDNQLIIATHSNSKIFICPQDYIRSTPQLFNLTFYGHEFWQTGILFLVFQQYLL